MVEEERAGQAQQEPEPGSEPEVRSGSTAEPELSEEQRRQRNLRVSDAEREHVVELLKRAIGRGMLDLDEFTERTDTALAARTRGELNAVLVDLPGLVHQDAMAAAAAPAPGAPGMATATPVPGVPSAADRLELKAHGSTLNRGGRWYVPAEVLVRNKYGHTLLDFTEAQVASSVVHLELDTKWGSVTMVIPEEAAVDVNGITEVKWGNLDDKTRSNGKTGTPRYVVTGRVHGGSLTIKNPRRGLFSR
ncbi:DUF1707 SHOCT-like domain-containing protein [Amycolatopsis aidingensis]|uniref:DUF1707 SHOCT-like domain-containing protein n=1 Tax=Amycolatopsis aidingensis TaxID=2842453 RepID=UPI001C0D7628|nr:DUF1707 domain-containing protein [Amycolatopsis aidingensis]